MGDISAWRFDGVGRRPKLLGHGSEFRRLQFGPFTVKQAEAPPRTANGGRPSGSRTLSIIGSGTRGGGLSGDVWGGITAMLVAVPSAIAFGVTVFAPLGASYAAYGAIAGMLGAVALGLVTPAIGGTGRLITAPCAPAAAVLAALAIQLVQQGTAPRAALVLLMLTGLMAGLLQVVFGVIRIGKLISFMPYPVVSGYLSGVGLIIILSQLPLWLGGSKGTHLLEFLARPADWGWHSIAVGAATMIVMATAPRVVTAVPGAILGLAAGVLAYFGLALVEPSLLRLEGNPMIVGPLGGADGGFVAGFLERWTSLDEIGLHEVARLAMPAATLAVLLSIDTLKTCVVLDAVTRSRHNSNRELIGQGLGNLASASVGGMSGAGQMGATLVNMSSGGRTWRSGSIEGVLALAVFLLLGDLVAWVPVAALSGILIVVGVRMIDWKSLHYLKSRSTVLDFLVIVAVVVTAKAVSLIAASGAGVALAIFLYVREQTSSSIVYRRNLGHQRFSKQVRLPDEMKLLTEQGEQTAIFELQGSLFFGTADKLYRAVVPDLKARRYIVLDMRRVQSVDVTAAHVLGQIEDALRERGASLIFSHLPRLPGGREVEDYFSEIGLVRPEHRDHVFGELDGALEWVENRILADSNVVTSEETLLGLHEMNIFKKRRPETLADLEACMRTHSIKAGEQLFASGDQSDELYLIRRGAIRIVQRLARQQSHHLATFRQGDFLGEMAFLDREPRSADAYAERDTDLYVLSRAAFTGFAASHKKAAMNLLESLAVALSHRLRFTNVELRDLEEG